MFSYIKTLLGKKNIVGISNPLQLNFEGEDPNGGLTSSTKTTSLLGCLPSTETSIETVTLSSIYAPHHLENFQVFKDRANKAFDGAFPKTSRPRYTKVKVLLLSWKDDDLGVDSELKNLGAVFERAFRFETESWGIPSLGSEEALTNRVFKFRSCAASDQLLIVYYGGHADRLLHNHCIWRCRRNQSSSTLDWSLIQPFLLASPSDTLVLLDCCFAARGGKDITPCQTTNEVIAACSPESPATGVERRSFTSAMTRELELLAHKHETQGTCFTAVSLHSALFRYDRELRYAPFYVRLTDHECMSIDITPLPRTPGLHCAVEMIGSMPEIPQGIVRVPEPGARILLAINTTQSPGGDLVAFLRSEGILPEYVSSMEVVKVEAVYRSRSTLTLVSLPMEVWSLLPKDAACLPIGTVYSGDLLQEKDVVLAFGSRVSKATTERALVEKVITHWKNCAFGRIPHFDSGSAPRPSAADRSRSSTFSVDVHPGRDLKTDPSASTGNTTNSKTETATPEKNRKGPAAKTTKSKRDTTSLNTNTTNPRAGTTRLNSLTTPLKTLIYICCQCGDGPKVWIYQPRCINCGYHFCTNCRLLK